MLGQVFEKYAHEYAVEKITEDREARAKSQAIQMLTDAKLAFEDISKYTGLPLEEVKLLAKTI